MDCPHVYTKKKTKNMLNCSLLCTDKISLYYIPADMALAWNVTSRCALGGVNSRSVAYMEVGNLTLDIWEG